MSWHLYVPPARYLLWKVADWAEPLLLTLTQGGPLEIKVNEPVRVVAHSVGPVFWVQGNFVGKKKVSVGDLLEFSVLPRGKYLLLPVGPVGEDVTSHWMCPCGSFLTLDGKL